MVSAEAEGPKVQWTSEAIISDQKDARLLVIGLGGQAFRRSSVGRVPPIGPERSSEKLEVRTRVGAYPWDVSVAENPSESGNLTVVVPKDALLRAQALPSDDDMAVEGVTAEEWDAFEQALADR